MLLLLWPYLLLSGLETGLGFPWSIPVPCQSPVNESFSPQLSLTGVKQPTPYLGEESNQGHVEDPYPWYLHKILLPRIGATTRITGNHHTDVASFSGYRCLTVDSGLSDPRLGVDEKAFSCSYFWSTPIWL
ncbi:hypothetical protein BKA70DRAFT_779857 [Coprinopsis sp. MPI-PUGE-AT-0042]|nr:hypothetical protein BKA70DRAFT_779857 [Coprinopsis sp. MPI-PUGE-AT-0042]